MGIFNFNEAQIIISFLIFIRMSAFVVSWPVFGATNIPNPVKILFALVLTIVMLPTIPVDLPDEIVNSMNFIILIVKEAFIGLAIGFLGRLFFFAVHIAGQIISVSMGLAGAQLYNPSIGEQTTAIDQLEIMLASLFFIGINGHHMFLTGLVESFQIVPVEQLFVSVQQFGSYGRVLSEIMIMGIKISAPIMVSLLLMNVMMGIIGRAVPQINVLITSLPVNILVGFVVMIFSLPLLVGQMDHLIFTSADYVFKMMKGF